MIISLGKLLELLPELREKGRIVSTNGCFDFWHAGHTRYLKLSKSLGSTLIVLVNSDSSVKVLKGLDRPKNSEKIRAEVVAEQKSVDYVVIFDDVVPNELLKLIKPDIHTKAKDYTMIVLPEQQVVEQNGGRIELIDFTPYSTTIDKVKFITED